MSNCCCYSKCSQNINNRCVANIEYCKDRKASFNALDWYKNQKKDDSLSKDVAYRRNFMNSFLKQY